MSEKEPAKTLKGRIADLIFPGSIYCISCGNVIDRSRTYSLCDFCVEKLGWNTGDSCAACGRPLDETLLERDAGFLCPECSGRKNWFDRGFACAAYGLYERMLVSDLKERGRTYIARYMAEMMADMLSAIAEAEVSHAAGKEKSRGYFFDMLIPVPPSKQKLKRRGFNQAGLIAVYLGEQLGVKVYPDILLRKRETASMKELSAVERAENVKDAFSLDPDEKGTRTKSVSGRKILLVDDVMTTGSTLNSCAEVLKKGGASRVYTLVFAAGQVRRKAGG